MLNTLDKNAVETLVADFDSNFRKPVDADILNLSGQIEGLQSKSRDRTYDMVAALVDLAISLDIENPKKGYQEFIAGRGIRLPGEGKNPYPTFIKAVFAVELNGAWVFGKGEQRSYEKHANHVRYLVNAKRAGELDGMSVQDFIRSFSVPSKGDEPYKWLRAIEIADRAANPDASAATARETVRNRGYKADPVSVIAAPASAKENEVVKLWGRVRNGQLEVMMLSVANDDEAESLFYKLGQTIKTKS